MSMPRLLWIGSARRAEFRQPCAGVARRAAAVFVPGIRAAAAEIAVGGPPDLIVLAQARPSQHEPAAIERLRRQAPAARWIVLGGSWCEGELRSGRPLAGAARVYWHQWPIQWPRDCESFEQGDVPVWGLPATAQEEDRLLADLNPGEPDSRLRIAVASADFEMHSLLRRALAGYGSTAAELDAPRLDGVVWDARSPEDLQELAELRRRVPSVPIVALAGFPRWQDVRSLRALGAAAIVSKPFLIDELLWLLARLARGATAGAQPAHSRATAR
ncbi:MAG: hypothetical protein K1X74_08555 [Pirellulales bacterium]|nr:hypothetical protein [Pirellulales bacterium]